MHQSAFGEVQWSNRHSQQQYCFAWKKRAVSELGKGGTELGVSQSGSAGMDSAMEAHPVDTCSDEHVGEEVLFVSYMGTYNPTDALTDLKFLAHPSSFGRMHKGFVERAKLVPLLPLLEFLRPPDRCEPTFPNNEVLRPARTSKRRLVLCGHSLGGAVAVAMFMRLVFEGCLTETEKAQVHVITFGQPLMVDAVSFLLSNNFFKRY